MEQVTGVVEDAGSRDVTTKYGEKKVYHIVVDGETFKNGFKKPRCAIGDTVAITFEESQYGNEISSVSVSSKGTGETQAASVQSAGAAVKGNNVQAAIIRQNCIGNAREIIAHVDVCNDTTQTSVEETLMNTIKTAAVLEKYCDGSLSAADLTEALKAAIPAKEKTEE